MTASSGLLSEGSGVIISRDGWILTSFHLVYNRVRSRPHAVFAVAVRSSNQRAPYICAGQPAFGVMDPAHDLALIRCQFSFSPTPWADSQWPAARLRRAPLGEGERVWILGYPESDRSGLQILSGRTTASASAAGAVETDAPIRPGFSGGPALDDSGRLVGVAASFHYLSSTFRNTSITTGRRGVVRAISSVFSLIEATVPREMLPGQGALSPSRRAPEKP